MRVLALLPDTKKGRSVPAALAGRCRSRKSRTLQRSSSGVSESQAKNVKATFNTKYHFGTLTNGVSSSSEAVTLTQSRINAGGWNGPRNHVAYDFNVNTLENHIYQALVNGTFHTVSVNGKNHYLIQLPDLNWWVVDRTTLQASKGGGQCGIFVDPSNWKAYHMLFFEDQTDTKSN